MPQYGPRWIGSKGSEWLERVNAARTAVAVGLKDVESIDMMPCYMQEMMAGVRAGPRLMEKMCGH
jgi:hypothetical protein